MLVKTQAIALQYLRFRETSLIVRLYTEQYGLQSYLVQGSRTPKSRLPQGLFQPLTLLEIIADHKPDRPGKDNLHRLREAHISFPYQQVGLHFPHTALALFLGEMLNNCLREDVPHDGLFEFLRSSCQILDLTLEGLSVLPIDFLVRLTRFLGFGLQDADQLAFALRENQITLTSGRLDPQTLAAFNAICMAPAGQLPALNYATRQVLLEALIHYLGIHLTHMPWPKSLAILQETLRS